MFFVAENGYADVKLEIRKTRNSLVEYESNATSNSAVYKPRLVTVNDFYSHAEQRTAMHAARNTARHVARHAAKHAARA